MSGVGALDFLDLDGSVNWNHLTLDMVEKWFCLGDCRNRVGMWVQGNKLS